MEFGEKFKSYSNTDLLRIIENPDDYQSQAVEAAKTVFSERQLSEMEIKTAKDELELENQENARKERQKQTEKEKVNKIGDAIFQQINPVQTETPTSGRTIKAISLFLAGLFLFQLYIKYGMIKFLFTSSYAKWDFSVVLDFFPLLIIPLAAILFYARKKTGWFLLTIFLTFTAVSAIGGFILALKMNQSGWVSLVGPHISPSISILSFTFYAGLVWTICREKIRSIYSVSQRSMVLTVILTASIVGTGIIALFLH